MVVGAAEATPGAVVQEAVEWAGVEIEEASSHEGGVAEEDPCTLEEISTSAVSEETLEGITWDSVEVDL